MCPGRQRTLDCVVCGSCVADILVRPFPLDRPVGPGTVRAVEPIDVATGGIVSNAATALARLGRRVAAVGIVGQDAWGRLFREALAAEGIHVDRLAVHPQLPTTTAVVMINDAGERSFAYCPGATEALDGQFLLDRLELFARSRMVLLGYYPLLPRLQPELPEILSEIRRLGCQTALDSAADGGSLDPLAPVLPHLDVYVPSQKEARHQTGQRDPQAMLDVYRRHGARGLLGVKLGAAGALLSPAPGQYVEIPPVEPPGPVVDTTGAGDAFYAGLLTGLLVGLAPADAGRLAAATASLSITAKGATAGLAGWQQTLQLAGLAAQQKDHHAHD